MRGRPRVVRLLLGAVSAIPLFAAGRVMAIHLVAPALRHRNRVGGTSSG